MKEKYIFFVLLIITLGLFIGNVISGKSKGEFSAQELALEKKIKRWQKKSIALPEKIDIDKIQNSKVFSAYENMLTRSPFFKVKPKTTEPATAKPVVAPVEEQTPLFIYKGKISTADRLVVIIEQTRSSEVFMVSKGEGLDGYKVLDITDTEVILSKKGEDEVVLKTIETP